MKLQFQNQIKNQIFSGAVAGRLFCLNNSILEIRATD